MNEYNILYQSLVKIKQDAEASLNEADDKLEKKGKELCELDNAISDTEIQLEEYEEKLSIIQNFKNMRRKKIINLIKIYGICLGVSVGAFSLIELILFANQFNWMHINGALVIAGVLCSSAAAFIYYDETRNERKIYKDEKEFSFMTAEIVKNLTKDLELFNEKRKECLKFYKEAETLAADCKKILEPCNEYINYLLTWIPEVSSFSRRDNETINEIFENDETIKDIIKLVRTTNNK